MTNATAVFLAAVILGALLVDYLRYDFENALFLAIKFDEFLEWVAFWR
ncbi:hypothetical protein [Actibacterium pelagium]|uniref:Uncharacterized protein n=1 Tax=Actibacterium pelagium TaxID=2029103 RepID=A0A917EIH4_9RHOB|nr:hypothetical protein [Actibacterium pelagium]GGE45074.1 hypothetical protein GCM10011517_10850 [Actibacterium pelagium]